MSKFLLTSPCGCVKLKIQTDFLRVKDSLLLPQTDINVIGILIDGEYTEINEIYESIEHLASELNDIFAEQLQGYFIVIDGTIKYYNKEQFIEIEIMAIYQNYEVIFKVGNPSDVVNKDVVSVANGDSITHTSLKDTVISVHVGSQFSEPIDAIGYKHTPGDANGTLVFAGELEDIYVYVQTKQVPS